MAAKRLAEKPVRRHVLPMRINVAGRSVYGSDGGADELCEPALSCPLCC
jgi:hypothetical protein